MPYYAFSKGAVKACTFHSWCWGVLRRHFRLAGFNKQPVIWTDMDVKEAVAFAIRSAELLKVECVKRDS
jgi:hypothetical protein